MKSSKKPLRGFSGLVLKPHSGGIGKALRDRELEDDGLIAVPEIPIQEHKPNLGLKEATEPQVEFRDALTSVKVVQGSSTTFNLSQEQSRSVNKDALTSVKPSQDRSPNLGQGRSINLPDCELLTLWFINQSQQDGFIIRLKKKEIGDAIKFTEGGVDTAIKRLRIRGLLAGGRNGGGRHNGGGIWHVTSDGLALLTRGDVIELIRALTSVKVGQGRPSKVGQGRSSIDNDDLISSSGGPDDLIPEDLKRVDLSEAHAAGVMITHKILADYGKNLSAEKIEEMLRHFLFEFRKGERKFDSPEGYFIGALKKGDYRKPKGFYNKPPVPQPKNNEHVEIDKFGEDKLAEYKLFASTAQGQQFIKENGEAKAYVLWLKSDSEKNRRKNSGSKEARQ